MGVAGPLTQGVSFLPEHSASGRRPWAGWLARRPPIAACLAQVLVCTSLVLAAATAVTAIADGDLFMLALLPGPIVAAAMGGLVTTRQPGHRVGTLLCAFGAVGGVNNAMFAYARAAVVHFPGTLPFGEIALWTVNWDFLPTVAVILVLLLVFPSGHLLSPRWRPALWAVLAWLPLAVAGYALVPGSMGDWFRDVPTPYSVPGPAVAALFALANASALVIIVAATASLVLRWRHATRVTRQQIRLLAVALPVVFGTLVPAEFFPHAITPTLVLGATASILLAVAIGLAVLRYRLDDIEVLLSRAVAYTGLSIAVAGLYVGLVAIAGGSFGTRPFAAGALDGGLSTQLLAAVVAAAVLLPVRGSLQRRIDRFFFGDRGTPYAAMARLGHQVAESARLGPMLDSLVAVVADCLRLPYAAVEFQVSGDWAEGTAWGRPPASADDLVAFPLTFQREAVGRLLVGRRGPGQRLTPDDEGLLASLARQVAPTAHAVALRQALDASRAGQVAAREEERRRLRRELHDRIGPTIAGLALGLDNARAARGAELPELLDRLHSEALRALADVRGIAYGLRPPALDEVGLAGALRLEADRLGWQAPGLPVTLDLPDGELPDLPAAVEVAAYRIVTESVTNVLRHAEACRCEVRVTALAGEGLRVEVRDDGRGMPEGWRAGVGVTAMRERAAELGGTLSIGPGDPRGTVVRAILPLGAGE
jgi:signal transduction histidine kinase